MDLDSYISRYTGESRLQRLLLIAAATDASNNNGSDLILRRKALHLAERQMKKDGNALLYRDVFSSSGGEDSTRTIDSRLFEGLLPYDAEWANATEHSNRETRHILEGRLSTAQSRLHKDAIRAAYLALAEHDTRTGKDNHRRLADILGRASMSDGETATGKSKKEKGNNRTSNNSGVNPSLYRAMDFCTTRLQTAQVGLRIIESALNAGDYTTVRDYVERLESTVNSLRDKKVVVSGANNDNNNNNNNNSTASDSNQKDIFSDISVKIQIAKGIERIIAGDYFAACKVLVWLLLKGSPEGGSSSNEQVQHALNWSAVTAPEDIALYAGVMCMVTSDRSKMLALVDHPEALELVPSVKEILMHWSRAKYAPCMQALVKQQKPPFSSLGEAQPLLPLADIYLIPNRWDVLVNTIREKCIVEYLRPYERVNLEELKALIFPSKLSPSDNDDNEAHLLDTLVDLMDRNLLPANSRLDCRERILFLAEAIADPKLEAMEHRTLDDIHSMLVRLACLRHDFVVVSSTSSEGHKRTGKKANLHMGRRYRGHARGGHSLLHRGGIGMADSSESDDENDDNKEGLGYASSPHSRLSPAHEDCSDTHMIDADISTMNPEDMY